MIMATKRLRTYQKAERRFKASHKYISAKCDHQAYEYWCNEVKEWKKDICEVTATRVACICILTRTVLLTAQHHIRPILASSHSEMAIHSYYDLHVHVLDIRTQKCSHIYHIVTVLVMHAASVIVYLIINSKAWGKLAKLLYCVMCTPGDSTDSSIGAILMVPKTYTTYKVWRCVFN